MGANYDLERLFAFHRGSMSRCVARVLFRNAPGDRFKTTQILPHLRVIARHFYSRNMWLWKPKSNNQPTKCGVCVSYRLLRHVHCNQHSQRESSRDIISIMIASLSFG